MYVIKVIPLSRNTSLDTLSYYSAQAYPIGAIIDVPVRKQKLKAVVIENETVSAAKTALRAATFTLRKLDPTPDPAKLPASLMATASQLKAATPSQLGSIIFALLPPDIRTGLRAYPVVAPYTNTEISTPTILTATRADRYVSYRGHIRETFAHRGSVLFVVPNSASVAAAKKSLEKGIEKRVITFSSTHTKKQIDASYEAITDYRTAKLIITTPNFALLDRHDLLSIIIEECGSSHYKTRTRPYLDARDVLKTYAKVTNRSLLMGDILPRTEEEALRRDDTYHTHEEHPIRHGFVERFTIATHTQEKVAKTFSIFTPELTAAIERTLANKGQVFLLAARRGLAPLVMCFDCQYVFRCPQSGTPYTLFETTSTAGEPERWFYSATSGTKVRASDTCPLCGSWRLRQHGVGIQQVVAEARVLFPTRTLISFDHTTANTHNKANALIKSFQAEKQAFLIGTNMALPYLTTKCDLTAVMSYEATRSIPSWRAEESVLSTLLTLREATGVECIIQTRSNDDPLLQHAKRGAIDAFYDEEIAMRKILSYPPFALFIHLTWQGTKAQLKETEALIQSSLKHIDMQCYNSPQPTTTPMRHALIRVARVDWPDTILIERLRALPPSIRIELSPERII